MTAKVLVLTLDPTDPAAGLHNDDKIVKQVLARLKRGPSASDTLGFIYMYKEKGANNAYRKIGRTKRLPDRRLAEWPGSVLVESWRCRRNGLAEILIHWLLDAIRVYRYVMTRDAKTGKETLLGVWKRTGAVVAEDAVYRERVRLGQDISTTNKRKHQEWFLGDEKTMIAIIESVTSDINMQWADVAPWTALMEAMK